MLSQSDQFFYSTNSETDLAERTKRRTMQDLNSVYARVTSCTCIQMIVHRDPIDISFVLRTTSNGARSESSGEIALPAVIFCVCVCSSSSSCTL